MKELIKIIDDFCPEIDYVRASALESGFGTWKPPTAVVGSGVYEGMNYVGKHSFMLRALAVAINKAPFPNSMFFRVTNAETEPAYTHSDRNMGSKTCVAYLSSHEENSGTGFYRHRATGLTEMPTLEELNEKGTLQELARDMVHGTEREWEQIDYVRGLYNRAVIFHAPLFHSRWPKNGIGNNSENGRMIWACHFNTLEEGGGF